MFIVVGLGNPTKEYAGTRHNVGFMAIDALAEKYNVSINKAAHHALTGTTYIGSEKVLFMKPLTYMNLSGEAVIDAVNFYKVDSSCQLLVIYDDISLDVGKLRLRKKGSAGGHNGIKNIIAHLGNDSFYRIKVGVGNKPAGYDLADYVLGHFSKEDLAIIKADMEKISDAVSLTVSGEFEKAMNLYN